MGRLSTRITQALASDSQTEQNGDGDGVALDQGRRQALAAGSCVAVSLFTGCAGFIPGDGATGSDGNGGPSPSPSQSAEPTPGNSAAETHVVGLHYTSGESASSYDFNVTVEAPEGDDVGADWWQVETLAGDRITRKTFSRPRGSRVPASKTIEVPDDVNAVVIRGHGREAGYGGQVMLADLEADEITLERQGPEPKSFEGYSF